MDISPQDMVAWRKKIELIGFDIKGLERDSDPSRLILKTKAINRLGIDELDKIGLQLIYVTGSFMGRLKVLLETKDPSIREQANP